MVNNPDFDVAAAHRYFAAKCFNDAWDLIEKPDRSAQDDQLMAALNQASIYHWMQRDDCDDLRLSVGYWQASRIQALVGNAAEAIRVGQICLAYSRDLEPFYLGYAHEALARAYALVGDAENAARQASLGRALAASVTMKADRDCLQADLAQLP